MRQELTFAFEEREPSCDERMSFQKESMRSNVGIEPARNVGFKCAGASVPRS